MKALIIGGARSGIGCARLLHKEGFEVVLTTNQDFPERHELESLGIHVSLDDKDMSLLGTYDFVIKNPGIPNDHPLVSQFPNIYNEIEIASRFANHAKFYAISGTNGKTTTTTCLHEMLLKKDSAALLAGNVGYALSEAIYRDGDLTRDVALEISAFQMEGTPSFSPEVYALMNLSPDHMDRYDEVDDYYKAKLNILSNVKTFIRNCDDQNIMRLTQDYQGKVYDLSMTHDADICLREGWVYFLDNPLFEVSSLKLVGKHNLMNAAFAASLAFLAGVKLSDIREVIQTFSGVEHRIEFVDEVDGVRYYNDSKATNPESTEVCLQAFEKPIILLAGGFDKHISFDLLKPYDNRIKMLFVFGESADQIREVFPFAIKVDTMKTAFVEAKSQASSGDIIVLSPACASYDQFENFEIRGNIFKEYVKTL
ncbi:UDP-N-acetylmuramoyl-L-alanine--D-glutamate ligase [Erysipelothrix rhusiopathiae]|uniref:UDP-N-acetylmuramoyl-L-alanine--D-glutamate ligase n=1 Tax=Erysipelothrix rhusiopathiae TaxID=1648 RepID=UPI0023AF1AC0|nr:UDP-N-acetylmuramoyl-L-alanine--D-glutamate ligase [Erysipelothrix rhusiopathiae]MDE8119144.1 UDP-N-acetylmuramoyl-L-alanine--D-glutamate ligase [Erysipelothrix rhusiopathiae]MDE8132891.1 UDP-N-acetylmuramoyl-L-alanine--D-glutamate ligase [Erysipelothrix rhusiopathiae]MDE8147007.1 UDP-N-acetylmuramoyl-L-alanine--D-glutamate ligase [Erysipelothrix rhusiopathiae]MDE8163903.1 UDP-N-acetylmuramoyl-L-alanine--D-glutamate ligase [Erysipelothrix rhusiopathiae]